MFSHFLIVCSLAYCAIAFQFPDSVPLSKRQQPGTPQYECHENCGGVITLARTENFCDSANFTSSLTACLECAGEFDIWKYYGESVGAAAQACGLEATPVASNATASSTTSANSSGTAESTPSASEEPSSSTAATTTAAASSSGSQAASSASSGAAAAATSANTSPVVWCSGTFVAAIAAMLGISM